MNNPWDALPKEAVGDGDSETLFAAVGRALTEWETMEGALGLIFSLLCGTWHEGPARAYGVVSSAVGRLDMLREVYACFEGRNEPSFSAFDELIRSVSRLVARRNEIAHGVVTHINSEGTDQGYFLCPASYNSRKRLSRAAMLEAAKAGRLDWLTYGVGRYAYNSRQLGYYEDQFRGLREAITAFSSDLTAFVVARLPEDTGGDRASS